MGYIETHEDEQTGANPHALGNVRTLAKTRRRARSRNDSGPSHPRSDPPGLFPNRPIADNGRPAAEKIRQSVILSFPDGYPL